MALVKAYFDDSGTHKGAPVIVIGGLLGPEAAWEAFDAQWTDLLKEPLPGKRPVKMFHAVDVRARRRDFDGYNEAECDRVTYLFRRLILDAGLYSLAVIIDKASWDELVTGIMRQIIGDAEAYCVTKCVDLALEVTRVRYPGNHLAAYFDAGRKNDLLNSIFDAFLRQAERYPDVSVLGWAKVADFPGMQGADMIATESYWYVQEWIKNGADAKARAHFEVFLKRELGVGLIADREVIQGVASRFREAPPGPWLTDVFGGQSS